MFRALLLVVMLSSVLGCKSEKVTPNTARPRHDSSLDVRRSARSVDATEYIATHHN
jgi:hypothetical protein